jgi:hypothetical protein
MAKPENIGLQWIQRAYLESLASDDHLLQIPDEILKKRRKYNPDAPFLSSLVQAANSALAIDDYVPLKSFEDDMLELFKKFQDSSVLLPVKIAGRPTLRRRKEQEKPIKVQDPKIAWKELLKKEEESFFEENLEEIIPPIPSAKQPDLSQLAMRLQPKSLEDPFCDPNGQALEERTLLKAGLSSLAM